MGWRGAIRSYNAAVRRAERDEQRRVKQYEKNLKQYNKMVELEKARHEAESQEQLITTITSLHHDKIETIDWLEISALPAPIEPIRSSKREVEAAQKLQNYRPGFFVRLFKLENWIIKRLTNLIKKANLAETKEFEDLLIAFKTAYHDWKENKELADKINSGNLQTYSEVITKTLVMDDLKELGTKLDIAFNDPKVGKLTLHSHGQQMIPTEAKILLKSGKLSEKPFTKARYFEIYQDYICSAALRVACDIFAILPVEQALVSIKENLLNPATGLVESQCILSVQIPRKTLEGLNLVSVDPSSCLRNFIHQMNFSKTDGFLPVKEIETTKSAAS